MKPIVYFDETAYSPIIGQSVFVHITTPHPKLGHAKDHKGWVTTSEVVKISPDGSFETLNTHYHKNVA